MHASFKSFRNFFLALFLIVGMGAAFITGMYALNLMPEKTQSKQPAKAAEELPHDIPMYKGAVFVGFEKRGEKDVHQYRLPLGSQRRAKDYYEKEMKKRDWEMYVSSDNLIGFYKEDGSRQAIIKLGYVNGKVDVKIELLNET